MFGSYLQKTMRPLLNLLWLLFGGFWSALALFSGGIALCLTVIGIPFGLQSFKIGLFVLWPFGAEVVDSGANLGWLGTILNIIWLVMGGLWAALLHLLFGLLLALTIVGLPFARQHFRLIGLCLAPFGKRIISRI